MNNKAIFYKIEKLSGYILQFPYMSCAVSIITVTIAYSFLKENDILFVKNNKCINKMYENYYKNKYFFTDFREQNKSIMYT